MSEERLAEIFSTYGLFSMIEDEKKELEGLRKEYDEVCEGKRYNPLSKENWKKTISEDILEKEKYIEKLEAALKERRSELK